MRRRKIWGIFLKQNIVFEGDKSNTGVDKQKPVQEWEKYHNEWNALPKKCPYSEFFWSAFSRIWIDYRDLQSKSPCSVQIRENADQKDSEYRHFLCSDELKFKKL